MHPEQLFAARKRVGDMLKNTRLKRGWTVSDMSKRTKMDRSTIYKIEGGDKGVMLDSIIIYRAALKTTV